ncbi:MAG TPA: type III-B CRISPR-associated protein Cas10/Cmr2, partial [Acidobacteriota bacterium]|nr:type III-B CRISPR-associated protein Cas10/Cmr2 [Acidobacteriota bacterium]
MKHVFVVSIGPVQDFIASARRSRDLWFGSWMLSELAKAAALKIIELNGNRDGCLIFPSPNTINELKPG